MPRTALGATRLLALLLLAGCTAALGSCAAPPPPPPAPPAPTRPSEPIPESEYLSSWVQFEVDEVFVGTPVYRSVLSWMVSGQLHNRGNRTLTRAEVLFSFEETGYRQKVIVLDTLQEHPPLPPGQSRTFNVSASRLEYGVKGPIEPAKVDQLAPPTVRAQVVDLVFEDEAGRK